MRRPKPSLPVTRGQILLPIQPLVSPEHVAGATIQERFEEFHRLNPWVLAALQNLTATYLDAGPRRIGMKMLVEVLRYEYRIATRGDEFKLNNSYTSRYARLMIAHDPALANVFEVRQLQNA